MTTAATIVVDVQNDFVDGSLGTRRGAEAASAITGYLRGLPDGHIVVGTQDWHIDPAGHFAPEGEKPDYQNTWPVHCRAGSTGAQVHANLDSDLVHAWFHKGEYEAAYSGFEARLAGGEAADTEAIDAGATDTGATDTGATDTEATGIEEHDRPMLGPWLRERGVEHVTVVGIATDFCVRATALDAVKEGFATTVIAELCSPVTADGEAAALQELAAAGVRVLHKH